LAKAQSSLRRTLLRKAAAAEDAGSNLIADRMRAMAGRAIRVTARIIVFLCGLGSLFTAVPYAILRGAELPIQSEWVIFLAALLLLGVLSVTASLLPQGRIAKACRIDRGDSRLIYVPLRMLGSFAAVSYLIAVLAYFAPHTWNLNPQVMLGLCPMYFLKMTIDPSAAEVFLLLGPMNAAVYGALGFVSGYAWLALRRRVGEK
jgi:hypothetical protein